MYPQRQLMPFQYGFPRIPQPGPITPTAYNRPGTSSVSTGPGGPQQPGLLQQYAPNIASSALRQYGNYSQGQAESKAFDAGLKNNFGLDQTNGLTEADRIQFGQSLGGDYPGYYTGPEGTAASTEALDASSPYAAANLPAGADATGTGAVAGTTSTTAGTTAATGTEAGTDAGLLGEAGAGTAYASPEAAAAAGTGAADAGLLSGGLDAAGAGAADAGLLGGAAAGGEAAAGAAAAGEGTAAAVGATNFWNPVGWAALAGLAAYEMGLFD